MSRLYVLQFKQSNNNYIGPFEALRDYATGWRTLFNPKRWAIRRALKSFDANKNDIITHLLNEIPSLKTIDPSSKLAAVFYVIRSNTQFADNVQQDLDDIVKQDAVRKEATMIKMLSRYSAFWIVRLFRGEMGNEHVKEVRNLLKEYRSKQLTFLDLMKNIADLNVADTDPLNDFKAYFINQAPVVNDEDSVGPQDSDNSTSSTTSNGEETRLRQEAEARRLEEDLRIAQELEKEEQENLKEAEARILEEDRRVAEQLAKEEAEIGRREEEKRVAEYQNRLEEEQRELREREEAEQKRIQQAKDLRQQELLRQSEILKAEMQQEREQREARLVADRLKAEQLKKENEVQLVEEKKREAQRQAQEEAEKRRKEMELLKEEQARLDKKLEARRRQKEEREAERKAQEEAEARRKEEERRKAELREQEEKRNQLESKKILLNQLLVRYLQASAVSQQLLGLPEDQYQHEIVSFRQDIISRQEALLRLEDINEINKNVELFEARIKTLSNYAKAAEEKRVSNKQFLQNTVSQCENWLKFYKQSTFNNNLPVCKRLNAISIQDELSKWMQQAKEVLTLAELNFCNEFEKMPKIKEIADKHLAFVKEYHSESAVEADRQRCLLNTKKRILQTTQNLKNLGDVLATPLLYLGIGEAELLQKNQEINALDDSLKTLNSDVLQGYTLKELQDVDSRIIKMQEQINKLQLNNENKDIKENCKAMVSSITLKMQNILKYIGIYSAGSYLSWGLNRDANELTYHTAKKISDAFDPQVLHHETKQLCSEIDESKNYYCLSSSGLSYININNAKDLEAFNQKLDTLQNRIETQHKKNEEFLELCRNFSAESDKTKRILTLTYQYVHSVITLIILEKTPEENKIIIDAFKGIYTDYYKLSSVVPLSYGELKERKDLADSLFSFYKSLNENEGYPRLREHCEVVCDIAKKVFADKYNQYFITPIFKDCDNEWEVRIQLNKLAIEANILFTKDMDILGGGFFGPQPPINYNYNYVQDHSADEAARRAKIATEEDRRRLEEHRRRKEELRLLFLRILKAKVLSAVKENRNDRYNTTQWNIDYNDEQLSEKIDALFKRENFKLRSVAELAHEVVEQLNQAHQKVQRVYYSYN